MKKIFLLTILIVFAFLFKAESQTLIYDDFSKKDMPGWSASDGISMKYSFSFDNKDSGYAILKNDNILKPSQSAGSIIRLFPYLFTDSSYLNIFMKGVNNDLNITVSILFDIDDNGRFNEDQDILLKSAPISLNYSGWKQAKLKLKEGEFQIVSNFPDNWTVILQQSMGIRIDFETGNKYKDSKFESGIALISEIINKGTGFSDTNKKDKKDEQSYFSAKNYPNPFNPSTTIQYTLNESTQVKLTVYDRLGREVVTLVDESQSAGTYTVNFDASNLPSGTYFYRIKTPSKTEVKKMVFEK